MNYIRQKFWFRFTKLISLVYSSASPQKEIHDNSNNGVIDLVPYQGKSRFKKKVMHGAEITSFPYFVHIIEFNKISQRTEKHMIDFKVSF